MRSNFMNKLVRISIRTIFASIICTLLLLFTGCKPNINVSSIKQTEAKSPISFVPTQTISFTQNGFEPKYAIVKINKEVTFKNTSDQPVQIASDPYPTDDALPDFASHKPIYPSEKYEYTFTHIGEFGYHNELNPSISGKIMVK